MNEAKVFFFFSLVGKLEGERTGRGEKRIKGRRDEGSDSRAAKQFSRGFELAIGR